MIIYAVSGRERQGASSLEMSTEKWHEDCLIMLLPVGKLVLWLD
jgi:hypothetical protein